MQQRINCLANMDSLLLHHIKHDKKLSPIIYWLPQPFTKCILLSFNHRLFNLRHHWIAIEHQEMLNDLLVCIIHQPVILITTTQCLQRFLNHISRHEYETSTIHVLEHQIGNSLSNPVLPSMAIRLTMEYNITTECFAVYCITTQLTRQSWITICIKDCGINHCIPSSTILGWHRYTNVTLTVHDVIHEQAKHLKHKRWVLDMVHT